MNWHCIEDSNHSCLLGKRTVLVFDYGIYIYIYINIYIYIYTKNTQGNISLCFIKHHVITTYVEVEVQSYSFLICAKNTGFLRQTKL